MKHVSQQITDLYSTHIDEFTSEQRYFKFSPGGVHEYYFRPTSSSVLYLADMIDGEGSKRRSAFYLFKICSIIPSILKYIPMISETKLVVGKTTPPEVIASSTIVRLISQSGGVVHTVALSDPEKVRTILDNVLLLPDDILTPKLLDWDHNVPYFTEEFIQGDLAGPPTTDWRHYISTYKNLSQLYGHTLQEPNETTQVINSAISNIEKSKLNRRLLTGIRKACRIYNYPKYIKQCRIHGDVNQRNIIVSKGKTYLIDWEESKIDYATYDLFRPFLIQYYDTRNAAPIIELAKNKNGRGADFAAVVGPDMYGESKWYPGVLFITLLRCLNQFDHSSWMWNDTLEIIKRILKSNSWINP